MAQLDLGDKRKTAVRAKATFGQNMAVLWAVVRKEWLIQLRYPMNLIMRFIEPLMGGSILQALFILVPTVIGLYGFGIAYAGIVLYLRDANTLTDVGDYVIGLLSGEHFPVTTLPKALLVVSFTLPMTYAIDTLRTLLLGTKPLASLSVSVGIIIVAMFVFILIGNKVFTRIDAKVRGMGTLSTH